MVPFAKSSLMLSFHSTCLYSTFPESRIIRGLGGSRGGPKKPQKRLLSDPKYPRSAFIDRGKKGGGGGLKGVGLGGGPGGAQMGGIGEKWGRAYAGQKQNINLFLISF